MKEKIIRITFCSLFILIIFVMAIITITNNNELSKKEGRRLTQFPKTTIKSVLSTEYYTELTNAFSDQLAFREDFIKLYYLMNLQRYTGDVVKGENDELFLSPQIFTDEAKTIASVVDVVKNEMNKVAKEVTENGSKFIFLSIPRKDVMMEKYLPETYIKGTETYVNTIKAIEENKGQYIEGSYFLMIL